VYQIDAIDFEGVGTIGFQPTTGTFVATCGGHHRCSRTKVVSAGRKKGQGEGIGFLAAWLLRACDAAAHIALEPREFTQAERQAARDKIWATPGAAALMRHNIVGDPRIEPPIVS